MKEQLNNLEALCALTVHLYQRSLKTVLELKTNEYCTWGNCSWLSRGPCQLPTSKICTWKRMSGIPDTFILPTLLRIVDISSYYFQIGK
jgi:hypothetical protein